MAGTIEGGKKSQETIVEELGVAGAHEWRVEMGRRGGLAAYDYNTQPRGFARDPEKARVAGIKGGSTSRRNRVA